MILLEYQYLTIDLVVLMFAIIIDLKYNVPFNRRQAAKLLGIIFVVGVVWDYFAIKQGHWFYPQGRNVGLFLLDIPLEDYLFILVVPYFVITVFFGYAEKREKRKRKR